MTKNSIFESIRNGLDRSVPSEVLIKTVKHRIQSNPGHTIPARSFGTTEQLIETFIKRATLASTEIVMCDSIKSGVKEIIFWLEQKNINQLTCNTSKLIDSLKWPAKNPITLKSGIASVKDITSLTDAFAGISETGTIMIYSSAKTPTTLAFLPDHHLVLLLSSQIVGSYEAAWEQLKQKFSGEMPRNVNLITGPSRSADIEQTLLMGAHGPKNLVIFLVSDI